MAEVKDNYFRYSELTEQALLSERNFSTYVSVSGLSMHNRDLPKLRRQREGLKLNSFFCEQNNNFTPASRFHCTLVFRPYTTTT